MAPSDGHTVPERRGDLSGEELLAIGGGKDAQVAFGASDPEPVAGQDHGAGRFAVGIAVGEIDLPARLFGESMAPPGHPARARLSGSGPAGHPFGIESLAPFEIEVAPVNRLHPLHDAPEPVAAENDQRAAVAVGGNAPLVPRGVPIRVAIWPFPEASKAVLPEASEKGHHTFMPS